MGTSSSKRIPFLNGIFSGQIMQPLCHCPCHPVGRLCALCWCVTPWFHQAPLCNIACLTSTWLHTPPGAVQMQSVCLPDFVDFLRLYSCFYHGWVGYVVKCFLFCLFGVKHVHTPRVCTGCFNLKINLIFYAVPVSEFLPDDSICSVQLDEKFWEASEKRRGSPVRITSIV